MSSKTERSILAVLEHAGYSSTKKITDTLQGSIWSSIKKRNTNSENQSVVIKVTSRKLHKQSMIIHDGKKYRVDENVIKEKEILKYLTNSTNENENVMHNCVKYIDFFKSNANYYFVMQNGGHMLFDFVVRVHQYINMGQLEISEWHSFVKIIFSQILNSILYIHSKNVCHFDISLENILINDVEVILDSKGKFKFCAENVYVKLCDFGLSEHFITNNFTSTKYCGKQDYKSPECTNKNPFNAQKNDIWCTGICLFMMLLGGNMVNKADETDNNFVQIISGNMKGLLKKWNRSQYVNDQIIDLLNKIFKYEKDRINDISQIKQHKWLNN